MKIIRFQAENFKKLKAVEITPEGNVITITGKNAAGKSSVLDAIWATLCGGSAMPARPLRDGAESGFVELDLGDYVVRRTFTDAGTTGLTLKSADGAKYSSPQTVLNGIMGTFTFNPVEFLDAKDKRALLLKTIELKPDWNDWMDVMGEPPETIGDALAFIEATRKEKYAERTDINRERDRLKKSLETASVGYEPVIGEPVSLNALIAERDAAQANNRAIETANNSADELRRDIERLRAALDGAEKQLAVTEKIIATSQPSDVASITARISTSEQSNRRIIEGRAREKQIGQMGTELARAESQAIRAGEILTFIDDFKCETLDAAEMPVPGIGFDLDGNATLDGIPFEQCSGAQKLKTAIAIAIKANPKLRVMRIENGEKFDTDSLKIIAAMAQENNYQIWLEFVDESGKVGIYIEDGSVVA
mgnify:CR=1 FL=1